MLLFCDSFDHYTTQTQALAGKWTSITGNNGSFGIAGSGRFGGIGWSAQSGAGGSNTLTKILPTTYATLIVGTAFKHQAVGALDVTIISLWDTVAGGEQLSVRYSASKKRLYISRNGTTVATSTSMFIYDGVYNYIELKATIHNTTGSYEVHVNGVQDASLTASGVNTRGTGTNNSADTVRFGFVTQTNITDALFDDIYICDTSGSDNTDFLGDIAVDAQFPDADSATHNDWTPNTLTVHYNRVNQTTPDDDTTYLSDSTPGHIDTWSYQNLRQSSGTIKGIQFLPYARKDDAGTRQIAPVVFQSATDYVQSTLPSVPSTYSYLPLIVERNPATSAAWTISDFNADEFGVKEIA